MLDALCCSKPARSRLPIILCVILGVFRVKAYFNAEITENSRRPLRRNSDFIIKPSNEAQGGQKPGKIYHAANQVLVFKNQDF